MPSDTGSVGALAAPLFVLGAAGVAAADNSDFHKSRTSVNEHGAWTGQISSHASTRGDGYGRFGDRGAFGYGGRLAGRRMTVIGPRWRRRAGSRRRP
ncbi:hypothetical protein ACFWM0_02530 [Streptomyces sp. NPDC058405]|uniref:hypothetical protein n=1 Tax=Streptomyces sp. NPDC058405 TaxID=3346482 RepID=UPI00365597E6